MPRFAKNVSGLDFSLFTFHLSPFTCFLNFLNS